ncbi:MAG: hypothetical protein FJW14_01065 [Acidimicrobiia bacterium]|nr:hypothetical protein [Acidimicrobiia bacterium]
MGGEHGEELEHPHRRAEEGHPIDLELLDIPDRRRWRAWLQTHHASSPGVWVIFHKAHTGKPSLAYEDFVREALCFGWIDSLGKRLDDDRFLRKVTPRRPTSKWSDLNRTRWKALEAEGRLAPPGRAAAPTANRYAPRPTIPLLPAYIAQAFKANAKAWAFFEELPPGERRNFVVWIHVAKRPETRERRIREAVTLLAKGRRLGLR